MIMIIVVISFVIQLAMAKKNSAPQKRKGDRFMQQMGLLSGDMDYDDDNDDIDLEAELKRLENNEQKSSKKGAKAAALSLMDIDQLTSNIDNLDGDSDAESSGSIAEADLMNELEEITAADSSSEDNEAQNSSPVNLVETIQSRLQMYQLALNSIESGPKKRRYDRAVKTLEGQLKYVKAGKDVNVEEIPPVINAAPHAAPSRDTIPQQPSTVSPQTQSHSIASPQTKPSGVALPQAQPASGASPQHEISVNTSLKTSSSVVSTSDASDPRLQMLHQRRAEYQQALLKAKSEGNTGLARKYLSVRKNFDQVITAIQTGQEVDLSSIPPSPKSTESEVEVKPSPSSKDQDNFLSDVAAPTEEEVKSLFNVPDETPADTMSSLEQRLKKYQQSEQEAKDSNNGGKARRMGRIVKQYMDAIKACKAGKPFDYSELPTPPGFAEIPLPGASVPKAIPDPVQQSAPPAPAAVQNLQKSSPAQPTKQAVSAKKPATPTTSLSAAKSVPKRQASLSIQGKQLVMLQERQREYKKAALDAKTHDDRELALKYLRVSKGMDAMINAASNGLPVDISQMPPEPATSHSVGSVVVESSEVNNLTPEERVTEFEKIISQLKEQMKKSAEIAIRFKTLGDIKNAFVFENLQQSAKKDIDAVQNAFRSNDPPPKYHYEAKKYSIIRVNTELGDGDLLVNIVKGLNFPLPSEFSSAKDLDTLVHYEFPWPQEDTQKGRTEVCKHSDNPTYDHVTKLRIDRRSKAMLRMFKSRKLKLELFYRRGFLKSDRHFATVLIKLDQLERLCTVHESFDLLDTNGRKEIGGNLEVVLKMREPLSQKQVEVIEEKWLTIDQFVRLSRPVVMNKEAASSLVKGSSRGSVSESVPSASSLPLQSLEVLKFEKAELDSKIRLYANNKQLSTADLNKLKKKSVELASKMDIITGLMRSNQLSARDYINILSQLNKDYTETIQTAANTGDRRRQQLFTKKKDLVAREIRVWQAKLKGGRG
ncbi:hypothetical protein EB796_021238 [Bugula neritina]|uniref:C2 domain-containing protein n=1 Tax=Bugula neritina TaxID=10212 RepID=A0A7J7J2V5_BUGNE|nr:hypothetical protein EB796_021238 [Bugula neritina]